MRVLVLAEAQDGDVKNVTREMLGRLHGHQVDVCGVGLPPGAAAALGRHGAEEVHSLAGEGLGAYSPDGWARALKGFIAERNYELVLAGATSLTKDLLPRVAGLFGSGMASEVIDLSLEDGRFRGVKPLFAGKCLATVEFRGPAPHFATVRPNALGAPSGENPRAGKPVETAARAGGAKAVVKEVVKGASDRLDLTEADIIVSGGRSLKSSENFKILHDLAQVLGATVGASRAAVDSGYAPHSMQVGQTGKTVSPRLYIACGISGAIQHLAGMRTSKVIVAINTDPDAPIFSRADYGIVGDLFEVVPLLTEEFRSVLGR